MQNAWPFAIVLLATHALAQPAKPEVDAAPAPSLPTPDAAAPAASIEELRAQLKLALEQLALKQKGPLFEETYGMPVLLRRST